VNEPLLYQVPGWVIALVLWAGLNLAWLGFYKLGRRESARNEKLNRKSTIGPVESAVSGLVALMLAFSFSLAATRHGEREAVIVREANAIGTAFLRCDFVNTSDRAFCRDRLRHYARIRVDYFEVGHDLQRHAEVVQRSKLVQSEVWERASHFAKDADTPSRALLLAVLNEVIDLSAEREAATRHIVAPLITNTMLAMCLAWAGFAGYAYGLRSNRRSAAWLGFSALVTLVVFITLDLDRPGRGLIRPVRGHSLMVDLMHELDATQ
jgi:hypothetical protein